jgi:hypothetical protein
MPDKPTTANGYRSEQVALVKPTCLYIATKLGDIMDELVVVGGLVPSLLKARTLMWVRWTWTSGLPWCFWTIRDTER